MRPEQGQSLDPNPHGGSMRPHLELLAANSVTLMVGELLAYGTHLNPIHATVYLAGGINVAIVTIDSITGHRYNPFEQTWRALTVVNPTVAAAILASEFNALETFVAFATLAALNMFALEWARTATWGRL